MLKHGASAIDSWDVEGCHELRKQPKGRGRAPRRRCAHSRTALRQAQGRPSAGSGSRAKSRDERSRTAAWTFQPGKSSLEDADRDRLALSLLPLVKQVALRFRQHLPTHVETDELVGAGSLGLVDALRRFDPTKGVKIEVYAWHRIRGAMLDCLRDLDGATRDLRRKSKKVAQACRELEAELGHPAGDEELARKLGLSLAEWHRTLQELQPVGIDLPAQAGWGRPARPAPLWCKPGAPVRLGGPPEESLVATDPESSFDRCYRREQREIVGRLVGSLPARERLILDLYYENGLSMKEIAARLELHESRVSQLHSAALARLRKRAMAALHRPCALRGDGRPVATALAPTLRPA